MADSVLGEVPSDWLVSTVGVVFKDFNGRIQTGPFGSQLHASDYVEVGIPTVMPANIGDNRIIEKGISRIRSEDVERLKRHKLQAGDIVFSRRGDVERRSLVRDHEVGWLCGTGCLLVRPPSGNVDSAFLSHWFGHPVIRTWLTQHAIGATMLNLNTEILSSVPLVLPPLKEQLAIAEVLGAIDDKIESNRRLQELCMSLATVEHVYWRETVTAFIETTFGDFCDVFGGATPSTEEPSYWGGEHAWLTPTDVTALDAPYLFVTSRTLTDEGLKVASTRLHPIGTVFMTSRATIGAFAVTQIPCSTNQGFIAVQPRKDSHRWFIFHEMKSRVELMFDMSSGSTFRELSRGTFKGMAVNVPDMEADLDRLAVVLEPLHTKAMNASRENLKLCALRNALLPELLSGRLRVKDAESMMESV